MENASSQVSNLLRKESGESGSMMDPPNPSSKTDARSSFEGVRIAKHAMKKATKKARFLESAFVLLLRWSFLLPFAHLVNRSSFSLFLSLKRANTHNRDTPDARIERLETVEHEIEEKETEESFVRLGGLREGFEQIVVGDDGGCVDERQRKVEEDVEDVVERFVRRRREEEREQYE